MVVIKTEVFSQTANQPEPPPPPVLLKHKEQETVDPSEPPAITLNDFNVQFIAMEIQKAGRKQASLLGEKSETGSTICTMIELIKFLMDKAYPKKKVQQLESSESSLPQASVLEIPALTTSQSEAISTNITQLNNRRRGSGTQKVLYTLFNFG